MEHSNPLLGGDLFRQVVAAANIGFCVQDADEKVVYANDRLARMLGCEDPSELIGAGPEDVFAPAGLSEYRSYRQSWLSGRVPPHGLTLRKKDGNNLRALVSPYTALDGNGDLMLAAAFVIDVVQLLDAGPNRTGQTDGKALFDDLTARERQIVSDLILGRTARDIAETRCISGHTVRNHIKAVYRKLDVHSRLELMRVVMGDVQGATPQSVDPCNTRSRRSIVGSGSAR